MSMLHCRVYCWQFWTSIPMLCLLLHATISDIDECADPRSCSFSYLQYRERYHCENAPRGFYYVSVFSASVFYHKSRNKIIIIGTSFYPLWSTIIEKRFILDDVGALFYLHSTASTPIYHPDIKTTNILLDDKYRTKVADLGTWRSIVVDQTHLTTVVHGIFGYLNPKYFQSS